MNLDALNRWMSLVASLGVIAGLVLLAFELNQNRHLMRAQIRNEIASGVIDLMNLPAANPQLANVIRRGDAGEELTADEQLQYRRYVIATLRYYENTHYQYRQGLYDESEFAKQKEAWKSYALRSQGSAELWCELRSAFSTEFAKHWDAVVAAIRRC